MNKLPFLMASAALALAGCETVSQDVAEVVGDDYHATLLGSNEIPRGDPDGTGTAHVTINDVTDQICAHLEVRNISGVTAAHIHEGPAGVNGPPVVTLDPPDDNDSDDCDTAPDSLLDRIERNPLGFYVNVHTIDYPNGAIRGQLVAMPH